MMNSSPLIANGSRRKEVRRGVNGSDFMTRLDTRLWHPWRRINRLMRVMLHTRWSGEQWSVVMIEFRKAVALRGRSELTVKGTVLSALEFPERDQVRTWSTSPAYCGTPAFTLSEGNGPSARGARRSGPVPPARRASRCGTETRRARYWTDARDR